MGRTKCANHLFCMPGFASVLVAIVTLVLLVMEAGAEEAAVVSVTNPTIDNFENGGAVGLYFSATDSRGNPVAQLVPENVKILEDGTPVEVIDFRGEEQGRPVDIVVVFDVTESMGPFIDGMKEAAIDFADGLKKANRDFRLGLITFEDYILRDEKVFTRSAREFKSWVGSLRPAGGGDIPENSLDAVLLATGFPYRPDAQAVVILITDAPNHSRGDGSEKNNPYGREVTQGSGAEVLAEIQKANINVFAIAPPPFIAPDLHKFSKETGGRHYNIVSEGKRFPELIGEIGRSLASQYRLTYRSPRPMEDGTRRRISLSIDHNLGGGEATSSYRVRGVAGARAVPVTSSLTRNDGGSSIAYAWWNLLVPLFASAFLLVLSRVRLNSLPVQLAARNGQGTGKAGTPGESLAGSKEGRRYARLHRKSVIDGVPLEIVLSHVETTIGRGEECQVVISHTSISREHARIKKMRQGNVLFDLESRNGVHVNGRRIAENLLRDGMTVRIGDVEFVYYEANV